MVYTSKLKYLLILNIHSTGYKWIRDVILESLGKIIANDSFIMLKNGTIILE